MTDIRERARLFYDGCQAYVFGKDTNGVLPVDRDNLDVQLLLKRYGVVPSDDFFNMCSMRCGLKRRSAERRQRCLH